MMDIAYRHSPLAIREKRSAISPSSSGYSLFPARYSPPPEMSNVEGGMSKQKTS
jgi:hypothetical protein